MLKRIKKGISMTLAILLMLSLLPVISSKAADMANGDVVYCYLKNNGDTTGTGTAEDPYRYLMDAVDAVNDGGTIIINGPRAFVNIDQNDESGQIPWMINKNVTIRGEQQSHLIEVRRGGIVLGGNVTFENVTLLLANKYHNAIYANGHELTLTNVVRSGSGNPVHLYGGSMYYNKTGDTSLVHKECAPGTNAVITLNGAKTSVSNIYAGSVDGVFDGNTTIMINGEKGMTVGDIYASGSDIGKYDPKDMFDMNPPDAPLPNVGTRPVNGNVTIDLKNAGVMNVIGTRSGNPGSNRTTVQFSTDFSNSNLFLYDVDVLNVRKGNYAPVKERAINGTTLTAQAPAKEVHIEKYSGSPSTVLDLSKWGNTIDGISSISGPADATKEDAGILILPRSGFLFADTLSGTIRLASDSFFNGNGGMAEYGHGYVAAAGTGKIYFMPNNAQSDMTIGYVPASKLWKTSEAGSTSSSDITGFDIPVKTVQATTNNINELGEEENKALIPVNLTTEKENFDLSWLKLEYRVSYNGGEKKSLTTTGKDGYYTASSEDLNLCMYQQGTTKRTIWVRPLPDENEFNKTPWDAAKAGTYDIEITAPTADGPVTKNVQLVVAAPEEGTDPGILGGFPTDNQVYSYDGEVKKLRLSGNLGIYKDDIKLLDIRQDEVTVTYKDEQSEVVEKPVMPGTYRTFLSIPEKEGYTRITDQSGPTLVINKVNITGVSLSVVRTKSGADISGIVNGHPSYKPSGRITLTIGDKTIPDIQVRDGDFAKSLSATEIPESKTYSDAKYSFAADENTPYKDKPVGVIKKFTVPEEEKTIGWITKNGKKYYYDKNGNMVTGNWVAFDGNWYFMGKDGAMADDQWISYGGKWYYMNVGGTMAEKQWIQYGGKWYYLKAGGSMAEKQWVQHGGKWYYMNAGGAMATGWKKIGTNWYHLDANGVMATGWKRIGGKYYYFYSGGAMAVSRWIGNFYVNASGVWVR